MRGIGQRFRKNVKVEEAPFEMTMCIEILISYCTFNVFAFSLRGVKYLACLAFNEREGFFAFFVPRGFNMLAFDFRRFTLNR